jgi:uncharacterized protein DUF3857/transglutaminase superfamily protein
VQPIFQPAGVVVEPYRTGDTAMIESQFPAPFLNQVRIVYCCQLLQIYRVGVVKNVQIPGILIILFPYLPNTFFPMSRRSIACITSFLCLCLSGPYCPAQDKAKNTFGKISPADFNLPSTTVVDSSTGAVILSDVGEVHFVGNKNGWFSHVYKRQTRIKILDKRALGLATVFVSLYGKKDGDIEAFSNVQAIASNLENGQVVQTDLNPKDVYLTRSNDYWSQAKFSIPGVKEGSIIDYTYTITSDYNFNLPSWEFQWEAYPCLSSQYEVNIPQTMFYVLVRQGVHAYTMDKGSTGSMTYRVVRKADASALGAPDQDYTVSANTVKHIWAMKNIPAFGNEPYVTTPNNYLDKISFQLSGTYNGEETFSHYNTWAKATDELLGSTQFGVPLNEDDPWVDELADKIAVDGSDELTRAKAVYYYVSRHFTCTNHSDKYIRTTLKDVIHSNSGDVGEINLLLTALLRKKALNADPVLLSTREHGFNMTSYPVLDKLNYVIVRLKANGQIYFLDAAHPQLGFGNLATDCYNGAARIISRVDSGFVNLEADSLREASTTMVLIASTDKGMEGSWQSTLGPQRSYEVRQEVSRRGQAQYFKDIQTRYGDDLEIANGGIDSLDQLEEPAKVHYDFLIKQQPGVSVLYLDPIMGDRWQKNPFQAVDRKYPVEMFYATDHNYILSMEIPDGYTVDELPRSAKVAFNGDQGYFEYLIVQQEGRVELRCRVRLNKAWFAPEDYSALRDFFAFIVKKENEQIVLKKK